MKEIGGYFELELTKGIEYHSELLKLNSGRNAFKYILKTRNRLNEILAANTGKSVEEISRDTERDNYMTAEEAKAYGLIDGVVVHK